MFCEIPQFARCCFCMPLRRGVLAFGYLNIMFSVLMIGLYSYAVHLDAGVVLVYHGVSANVEAKLGIALYCVDIIFNIVMVYGAHKIIVSYLKIFYYYTISTTVALVILELVSLINYGYLDDFELMSLFFTGLCLHVYLLFLVRSLLLKINNSGRAYENQLHQFVDGEFKIEGNGIYPSTVVPIESV
ncbi:unnamed protein product, partial [Brenthis ino]